MPIAFDPPASAPHGTLPTRNVRIGDDAVSADIFTQLLQAAAGVQEAAAPLEAAAPAKDAKTADGDAPVALVDPLLMLPLPPAMQAQVTPTVTIVATEKRAADASQASIVPISTRGTAAAAAAMPATMSLPAHLTDASTALPIHTLAAKPSAADASAPKAGATREAAAMLPEAAHQATGDSAASRPTTQATLTSLMATVEKLPVAKAAQDAAVPQASAVAAHAAPVAPAPAPIVIEAINAPAFTPGWQDETVNKLAHIVLTRNERAELKLNPAELGPVSIRVEMNAPDQASLLIVAASPDTRSALEQSLPQLRDLLSSQGITLGQATVQDGTPQRDPGASQRQKDPAAGDAAPAPRDNVIHLAARRADRLVDLFA